MDKGWGEREIKTYAWVRLGAKGWVKGGGYWEVNTWQQRPEKQNPIKEERLGRGQGAGEGGEEEGAIEFFTSGVETRRRQGEVGRSSGALGKEKRCKQKMWCRWARSKKMLKQEDAFTKKWGRVVMAVTLRNEMGGREFEWQRYEGARKRKWVGYSRLSGSLNGWLSWC